MILLLYENNKKTSKSLRQMGCKSFASLLHLNMLGEKKVTERIHGHVEERARSEINLEYI